MQISVVTPSYNQLPYLKLCAASVHDQTGVTVQHIIQDAGSGPELSAWANQQPDLQLIVESDRGMYDAVNRGLRRAGGTICSYLNCDEQYVPGALQQVVRFFDENPTVDVVFAHAIVVNEQGEFVAYRKAILPQKYHTWVSQNLAIFTCATFFRRRILTDHELFFNAALTDVGDTDWVLRLLEKGVSMKILPIYTSLFMDTGQNRNLSASAAVEKAAMLKSAPLWARLLRKPIVAHYRLRRLFHGCYAQDPFDYAIYTLGDPSVRKVFRVNRPTFRWRR